MISHFVTQVKDVRVPEQLMRAMAAEAEAARNARAKVVLIMMVVVVTKITLSSIGDRWAQSMMCFETGWLNDDERWWNDFKIRHKVISAEGEHKASHALRHTDNYDDE